MSASVKSAESTFDRNVPQKQCSHRCRQRAYVLRHHTTTLFYYVSNEMLPTRKGAEPLDHVVITRQRSLCNAL